MQQKNKMKKIKIHGTLINLNKIKKQIGLQIKREKNQRTTKIKRKNKKKHAQLDYEHSLKQHHVHLNKKIKKK